MITIVIQAGGRSSRMGQDKAFVQLAGKPMIEHVLANVAGLGEETIITTNQPERYAYLGHRLVSDPVPGAGALPGLHTALAAAQGDYVLLIACDMPFVDRALATYLLSLAPEADVVVPMWEEYQTMCAVYARQPVLSAVENALAQGKKRMISFYEQVRLLVVPALTIAQFDPQGHSFFNVNTPADLAQAEQIYHQQYK